MKIALKVLVAVALTPLVFLSIVAFIPWVIVTLAMEAVDQDISDWMVMHTPMDWCSEFRGWL